MFFIDTHSHIAWAIDDGIASKEEAENALDMATRDHFAAIISTPHIIPGQTTRQDYQQIINARQLEAKELARNYGIQLIAGAELMINSHFLSYFKEGWIPNIENTNYVLVEFNVRYSWEYNKDYADYLYQLDAAGYIPIIAHVERYFDKGVDWDLIQEWSEAGFVLQINASSLLNNDSKYAYKNSWQLLKNGYGHLVASDTHRTRGSRIANLSSAYNKVSKKIGQESADLLFRENGKRIINNQQPYDIEPKKGLWFF